MLPAAILMAPRLGEASYTLLAVLGVYYFLQNGLYSTEYQNILLLSLFTLGFYLVALASVLVSDNHSAGLEKLVNLREFLAAPFIGLLLLDTRVSTRFIMLTVKKRWRVSMFYRPGHRLPGRLHGHLDTSSGKLRAQSHRDARS